MNKFRVWVIFTLSIIAIWLVLFIPGAYAQTPTPTPSPTPLPDYSPLQVSSAAVSEFVLSGSIIHTCTISPGLDFTVGCAGSINPGNGRAGGSFDFISQPANSRGFRFKIQTFTSSDPTAQMRVGPLTGNDFIAGTQNFSVVLDTYYCIVSPADLSAIIADSDFSDCTVLIPAFVQGVTKTDITMILSRSGSFLETFNFSIHELQWIIEGPGQDQPDVCDGTATIDWTFESSLEEWASLGWAINTGLPGAITPGEMVGVANGVTLVTSVTADELRSILGNDGAILSDLGQFTAFFRGANTSQYTIEFRVRYTDGSADSTIVNSTVGDPIPPTGWAYNGVVLSSGREIAQLDISVSNAIGNIHVDDIHFNVPCTNLLGGAAPTPQPTATPPPTSTPAPTPDPINDIIVPVTGLELVCYECPNPTSILEVSLWIAKLICILRNLFTCGLRIWLLNISNGVTGVITILFAFFVSWLPQSINAFIAWAGSLVSSSLSFFVNIWNEIAGNFSLIINGFIESIFNSSIVQGFLVSGDFVSSLFQIFLTMADLFINLITSLFTIVIEIVSIIVDLIQAMGGALSSNDLNFSIDGTNTLENIDTGQLYVDGPNPSKILMIFIIALSSVDGAIGTMRIEIVTAVILGLMFIALIGWTISLWKDVIPT